MFSQIRTHVSANALTYGLLLIILSATAVRLVNLNYNSPFNDEAIYVVLGRFGIFQGDWWTYNAAAWMAGQPYIYPSMTGVAYMLGGIVGSRLLNVIFGALTIEAIFSLTLLLTPGSYKEKVTSGFIAAVIIAASSVGYYVSRLATYDLPSFYFFILSLVFLWKGMSPEGNIGKWYFLAFVFIFLAFMSKVVIGLYIPFLVLYSGWRSYFISPGNFSFWKKYFLVPLVGLGLIYFVFNFSSMLTYITGQVDRGRSPISQVLMIYWQNTQLVWVLWIVGSLGMLVKKQWRLWLSLTSLALLVFIPHLLMRRWPTLDKHTFLTILFLAPIIGIGFKNLIMQRGYIYQFILLMIVVSVLIVYSSLSYVDGQRFNYLWSNSDKVLKELSSITSPGDKVLAEVGASAILANYDQNYPTYTTTFDWFSYRGMEGDKAYEAAIKDGYFDLIELDGGDQTLELYHSKMHNTVLSMVNGTYNKIYDQDGYLIYRRAF